MAKKSHVPTISKEELLASKPLPLSIGGVVVGYLTPKEFSTGSWGFGFNGKLALQIGNKGVEFQTGVNMTVPYSKEAAAAAKAATPTSTSPSLAPGENKLAA